MRREDNTVAGFHSNDKVVFKGICGDVSSEKRQILNRYSRHLFFFSSRLEPASSEFAFQLTSASHFLAFALYRWSHFETVYFTLCQ